MGTQLHTDILGRIKVAVSFSYGSSKREKAIFICFHVSYSSKTHPYKYHAAQRKKKLAKPRGMVNVYLCACGFPFLYFNSRPLIFSIHTCKHK